MNIVDVLDRASSVMTVLAFITFIGIMWWTFVRHRESDFAVAAQLPFADDQAQEGERHV